MNLVRYHRFAVAIVAAAISVAATNSDESVLGYWRLIKSERNEPDHHNPSGELEMKFVSGGTLIVKFRDQSSATNSARIVVGKFSLVPPDRITMSLDNNAEEHYRYLLQDGQLRMEHLDHPVTNTLKRLKAFSF